MSHLTDVSANLVRAGQTGQPVSPTRHIPFVVRGCAFRVPLAGQSTCHGRMALARGSSRELWPRPAKMQQTAATAVRAQFVYKAKLQRWHLSRLRPDAVSTPVKAR